MNLLPKAIGTRPCLACEISPEGVVAARAEEGGLIEEVARVALAEGAVAPGLKPGNLVDRLAVIGAMRRALEAVGASPNSRGESLTLILPDGAVRVLLLDFDSLPSKLTEALPIVRFRLKKLLPFEADDAMISYQIMSSTKSTVRVLAVAMPRDVLAEYETAIREAGYEPGAVLPSTLAALPAVSGAEPALIANVSHAGVTTAIVREGVLLLHRSIDLQASAGVEEIGPAVAYQETEVGEQRFPESPGLENSPYLSPPSIGTQMEEGTSPYLPEGSGVALREPASDLPPGSLADEIAQAVSVAAAYFEDTLSAPPSTLFSAGALGAEGLRRVLEETGFGEAEGLQVHELADVSVLLPEAVSAAVPRSALAGVVGALRG